MSVVRHNGSPYSKLLRVMLIFKGATSGELTKK